MRALLAFGAALLLASCASFVPSNPQLAAYDRDAGYRFAGLERGKGNTDSLFVILAFSGGGTRAAALSYGVMEELRATTVRGPAGTVRLLEEVDVISSVSGGSFTAAYYALRGERLFDEFPERFLYRSIQGELLGEMLSPVNWLKLAAPAYGRSDLAAEFYHRELFYDHERLAGATYADLIAQKRRPFVILNATDMTTGAPFPFIQDQFDPMCSDLAGLPIARAVAASSAFPGALTPLTFRNYAGSCGYRHPPWVQLAADDHQERENPRRTARAQTRLSMTALAPAEGAPARPYIHLTDGGVADNIGLREPLDAILSLNHSWSVLRMMNNEQVDRLVVIAVNAATDPLFERDRSASVPGLVDTVTTAATVPLANYSFDTVELLGRALGDLEKDVRMVEDCQQLARDKYPNDPQRCALEVKLPHRVHYYPVHVAFEYLATPEERAWFRGLPTTFELPRETVDKLRAAGRRLLREDPQFRKLLKHLNGG